MTSTSIIHHRLCFVAILAPFTNVYKFTYTYLLTYLLTSATWTMICAVIENATVFMKASERAETIDRLINSGCRCWTRRSCVMLLTRLMIDCERFVQWGAWDTINMSTPANIYFTVIMCNDLPRFIIHPALWRSYERYNNDVIIEKSCVYVQN